MYTREQRTRAVELYIKYGLKVIATIRELRGRYRVLSNRENGYGRYDVMLVPCDVRRGLGIVLEFKVIDRGSDENDLADTVAVARRQIEKRGYAAELEAVGVPAERIRSYGMAFEGKRALVG